MKTKWYGVIAAVSILLLICTGFAGAAAAADWSDTTPNTLFYFENVTGLTGTYSNMDETLTLDYMSVLDTVSSLPEGLYLNRKLNHTGEPAQIQLKKLDAEITMYLHDDSGNIIKSCIGDTVPQGAKVSFKVNPNIPTLYTNNPYDSNKQYVGLKFIGPDGSGESTFLGTKNYAADNANRWDVLELDSNLTEGTWNVWAYFVPLDKTGYFAQYTPEAYLNGQKYYFAIASSTVSMSAASNTAKVGGYVTITVSGKPNAVYYLKPNDKYAVNPGQQNYNYTSNLITIGKDGTTTLTLKAVASGTFGLQLWSEDQKIVEEDLELTFTKPKITAEVEKDSYYIGTDVKLTGTNEALYNLYYYIEGTNLRFTKIDESNLKHTKSSKEWETTIKGDYIKGLKLDTAAYTVFISNVNETDGVKDNVIDSSAVYTAVGVNLIKPEIRVTSAPSVVVHGDKLTVKGVADSAANVQYYIFGTNKFHTGIVDTGKNGVFTIEKSIDKTEYSTGQYFMVVQHPMYDGFYNIAPVTKDGVMFIALNNSGQATSADRILFSLNGRQSANAAQALCDVIDSEDIDDICTKFSFIVTTEGINIDPIPSQIIKGLPFTVSGSTNKVDGDSVIVELLSTAFTAASKYSATTASFITLTTIPDENGKWAVTFNTENLNVDDYTVTVTIGTAISNPIPVKLVEAVSPVITLTAEPANPVIKSGLDSVTVKFTYKITGDFDFASLSFGDGTSEVPIMQSGGTESHTYTSASTFTVIMQAGNEVGTISKTLSLPITRELFKAAFTATTISGEAPLQVTFTDTSTGTSGKVIQRSWDFGDGTAESSLTSVTHTFETEGTYYVKLFISDGINQDTATKTITVTQNPRLLNSLTLRHGWNFISVPTKLAAVNDTAGELFAGVNTDNKSPLIYNAESNGWEMLQASDEIKPLNAYWIYSVEEITLTPEFARGADTPGIKTLKKGWNSVGLSAESPMPASVAFNGLNWRTYLSWNAAGQKYDSPIVKGVSGTYGDENPVSLWKGGWVFMEEDGIYLGYA